MLKEAGGFLTGRPVLLGAAIFFYLCVNGSGLTLPHRTGDEVFYTGLAMKLDREGIRGYNLRGIDNILYSQVYRQYMPSPAGDPEGHILKVLKYHDKLTYYDTPLFTTPPLLPILIAGSHRLLYKEGLPYRVLAVKIPWTVGNCKAVLTQWNVFRTQAYAVLWPFLFGLGLVVLTFGLGVWLHSEEAGFVASVLLSSSPVFMLASNRLWSDNVCAFFSVASIVLYLYSEKKNSVLAAAASGASIGLAALAKTLGFFPLFFVSSFHVAQCLRLLPGAKACVRKLLNPRFIALITASFLVALPWYGKIYAHYGNPLYQSVSAQTDLTGDLWFRWLQGKPFTFYFTEIPLQTPLFFLAYPALILPWKKVRSPDLGRAALWVWLFVLWFNVRNGREERYLLAAFPAVALLSAAVFSQIRLWIAEKAGRLPANALAAAALIASLAWSLNIGFRAVYSLNAFIAPPS